MCNLKLVTASTSVSYSWRSSRVSCCSGISLIELMVTIIIGSLLIALSVWSIWDISPKMKLETASYEVMNGFKIARSEAIKKDIPVIVSLVGAGDMVNSSISVYLDKNRDGETTSDTRIYYVVIPNKFEQAYFASFRDCTGVANTIEFSGKGSISSVNNSGKGTMPIVVKLVSQANTDPASYEIVVERSGTSKMENGYTASCL